jgi:hypothetical protein
LANVSVDSLAQVGNGPSGTMRKSGGPGIGQFSDAAQVDELKHRLVIAPAEEKPWSEYANSLRETATTLQATRSSVRSITQQEQLARQQKAVVTVKQAAEKLLPALDDVQHAEAKRILPGLAAP